MLALGKREVQKVLCLMFCPPMAPQQWFSVPTCPPALAHVCPGDIFSSHNLDQCQHLGGSRPPHSKLPKRGRQCQVNRLLGSESPAIDGVSSRLPSLTLSEPLSSHHTELFSNNERSALNHFWWEGPCPSHLWGFLLEVSTAIHRTVLTYNSSCSHRNFLKRLKELTESYYT